MIFFFFTRDDSPKAVVSLYGRPDLDILEDSAKTLWACEFERYNDVRIVDLSVLVAVVSMQPLEKVENGEADRWFPVEKSGLEDVELTGYAEPVNNND